MVQIQTDVIEAETWMAALEIANKDQCLAKNIDPLANEIRFKTFPPSSDLKEWHDDVIEYPVLTSDDILVGPDRPETARIADPRYREDRSY